MAKIGRNAPCPCGSGKKYKKCCMTKDEAARPEAQNPVQAPSSFEKTAAPGGVGKEPRLHPHVLAKRFDDPELVKRIGRGSKQTIWTPQKLAAMSTEEIEHQLRSLGVDPSRERFLELARDHTSAWELSQRWLDEAAKDRLDDSDDDFLGVSACDLWKRYCPDRPSVEMLDDWMQEGYVHLDEQRLGQACDKWLELWQILLERLTPELRSTEDAQVLVAGTQYISNWIQDFTDALHNACVDDKRYAELGVEFFRQALEKLPDEHAGNRRLFRTEMAFMSYRLGRDEEGERILLELIAQEPDKAAGYVCLSDELSSHRPGGDPPKDLDRAIRLLEEALERPVDDAGDWDVERRLEYLRDQRRTVSSIPEV